MKKLNLIITWQAALSCLFLLGWTYTLKTNTPAGTDDPTEADDRMREIKAAFVERLDIDHYFYPSATSTYDDADTGKHRYITFREPNDLTSMAADESAIFSKDVSSVTELHWIDESDNVLQITNAGALNIVSADLLGTLANNTYFTAVDAAGTGTVDLIKADANDVAVVPDDSQTATNGAPTQSKALVNKKYVDDLKIVPTKITNIFGVWNDRDQDGSADTVSVATTYLAATDGLVHAIATSDFSIIDGFTDGNADPTGTKVQTQGGANPAGSDETSIMFGVRKGDYWRVVSSGGGVGATVRWLPIGQ